MKKTFTQMQLQAIADALGDTTDGLTGSEIHHLLMTAKIMDIDPPATKRHRIYNAFVAYQNATQDRTNILAFIRFAMNPSSTRVTRAGTSPCEPISIAPWHLPVWLSRQTAS